MTAAPPQELKGFITNLHEMANEPSNERGIGFSQCGLLLEIRNQDFLREHVLPKYFRHGNLRSLVRQLNNYGFVSKPTRGPVVTQCFHHALFARGREDSIHQIRRKPASNTNTHAAAASPSPRAADATALQEAQAQALAEQQYAAAMHANSLLNQRNLELQQRIRVLEDAMRYQPQPQQPQRQLAYAPSSSYSSQGGINPYMFNMQPPQPPPQPQQQPQPQPFAPNIFYAPPSPTFQMRTPQPPSSSSSSSSPAATGMAPSAPFANYFAMRSSGEQAAALFASSSSAPAPAPPPPAPMGGGVRSSGEQFAQVFRNSNNNGGIRTSTDFDEELFNVDVMRTLQYRASMESVDEGRL